MAEDNSYPHFEVQIDPDKVEVDFLEILHSIKPTWEDADIVFQKSEFSASKGAMNTMVKCYHKEQKDAMMVRVFNSEPTKFRDRSLEAKIIKELHKIGCAPKILATMENGFCYEYIHGEILTAERLSEEPIWKGIAKELAKFHSTTIEVGTLNKSKTTVETFLPKLWPAYPTELADPVKNEIFQKEFPPKEQLEPRMWELLDYAKSFQSPVVLCHNDNKAENIIWNSENQTIHFVDFEGMNYNFQAIELASHFIRFCGINPPDFALMPSEEFQMKWLKVYLGHYYKYTGRNPEDVKGIDVRKLYIQVQKFRLFFLYFSVPIGPLALALDSVKAEFDLLGYSLSNLKEYQRDIDRVMSLEMP